VSTNEAGFWAARSELNRQIARLQAKCDETLLGLRKNLVDLTAKLEKARIQERRPPSTRPGPTVQRYRFERAGEPRSGRSTTAAAASPSSK